MQIHVSNNCQVAPGEPPIRVWDVFSSSEQSRSSIGPTVARADVRKSIVAGLLPSGLFPLASCVCVCTACVMLKDRVTGQDVYLFECSD